MAGVIAVQQPFVYNRKNTAGKSGCRREQGALSKHDILNQAADRLMESETIQGEDLKALIISFLIKLGSQIRWFSILNLNVIGLIS